MPSAMSTVKLSEVPAILQNTVNKYISDGYELVKASLFQMQEPSLSYDSYRVLLSKSNYFRTIRTSIYPETRWEPVIYEECMTAGDILDFIEHNEILKQEVQFRHLQKEVAESLTLMALQR